MGQARSTRGRRAGGRMRACFPPCGPANRTICKRAPATLAARARQQRSRAAPATREQRSAPRIVRSASCAHGQVRAGCAAAGHAPGAPGLASTEAGTVAGGAPEPRPAAGADVWAEQSDMSLYHSAQGSFGMSSTASSAYASAMHMERSVARSRVQRAPLAEEGEDESSDADSFFSASDDGQEAEGECRSVRARRPHAAAVGRCGCSCEPRPLTAVRRTLQRALRQRRGARGRHARSSSSAHARRDRRGGSCMRPSQREAGNCHKTASMCRSSRGCGGGAQQERGAGGARGSGGAAAARGGGMGGCQAHHG